MHATKDTRIARFGQPSLLFCLTLFIDDYPTLGNLTRTSAVLSIVSKILLHIQPAEQPTVDVKEDQDYRDKDKHGNVISVGREERHIIKFAHKGVENGSCRILLFGGKVQVIVT